MTRMARVVAPGLPHHVTPRGNRRMKTFFEEGEYGLYLRLMAQSVEEEDRNSDRISGCTG